MSSQLKAPIDSPDKSGFGLALLMGACVGAGLALWLAPRMAARYPQFRARVGEAVDAVERVAAAARS